MVYFALTGGGDDEFVVFQRNVRMVRMFFRVAFFVGRLIFVEWLLNWAHDPARLSALIQPRKK